MSSRRVQSRSAVRPQFDLDVGVIYSGERELMTPLVTSLVGSADDVAMRLILVDNASAEGVGEWARLAPHAKIVANERRYGYAANLNRILAASDARYALLLNTDMYFGVQQQCLTKMVQFMDAHPRCGLSICGIYHPDGTWGYPARRFPNWRVVAARRLGLRRWFARDLNDYLYQERDRQSSFMCDWVSGCFMLVRLEAIREIGRFDELYVKYFEDVDISLRLARAGWDVMFNGQTHCFHHEQRASRRLLSRDAFWHAWAYLRWTLKWGGISSPRAPEHHAVEPARLPAADESVRRSDPPHPGATPTSVAHSPARPQR